LDVASSVVILGPTASTTACPSASSGRAKPPDAVPASVLWQPDEHRLAERALADTQDASGTAAATTPPPARPELPADGGRHRHALGDLRTRRVATWARRSRRRSADALRGGTLPWEPSSPES